MVDQDREAPPEQGEDTPPDLAADDPAVAEDDIATEASDDLETHETDAAGDTEQPAGASPDAGIEDVPSSDAPIDFAPDAEDESPPVEDAPEPPATNDMDTLDAEAPPAEPPSEQEYAFEASALEAVGTTAEATDPDTLDSDVAAPAATPESEPARAGPAGPAPGHLGALRSATPPAVGRWLRREARPRPPVPSRYTTEAPEWFEPEFEHQSVEVPSPPLGRSPGRLPAIVLAILMCGVFVLFVLIEPTPTWLLLFGAIMAALGTDGVLRSIRHRIFEREDGPDTVPHIFLPTLFALAIPLFIEENLESYWVIPAALVAGVTFVLVILAEVPAPEAEDDEFRGRARFVSVAATYFVGFALFSLTYTFDLPLRDALIVVALVSVLLAVELLREGEVDPLETLLLAGVVGVVVAEARWVLKYMPIDAYPAGLTLVLVFYFVTGMVHAYMTRHINVTVAAEYSIVTVLGLALVIAARATGIA